MWKLAENSSNVKPQEIDEVSSNSVVYVRKDFEEVPSYDEELNVVGMHWRYLENAIPKRDWEVYKQLMDNQTATTYLELAMCELYEKTIGGM